VLDNCRSLLIVRMTPDAIVSALSWAWFARCSLRGNVPSEPQVDLRPFIYACPVQIRFQLLVEGKADSIRQSEWGMSH
jgi:hypothetical protein